MRTAIHTDIAASVSAFAFMGAALWIALRDLA